MSILTQKTGKSENNCKQWRWLIVESVFYKEGPGYSSVSPLRTNSKIPMHLYPSKSFCFCHKYHFLSYLSCLQVVTWWSGSIHNASSSSRRGFLILQIFSSMIHLTFYLLLKCTLDHWRARRDQKKGTREAGRLVLLGSIAHSLQLSPECSFLY